MRGRGTRIATSAAARRQQQVIQAVREKALTLNMLPRYSSLVNDLGDTVETNIPPEQQLAFAQLAGQIKSKDIYTAQIDSTMVTQVAGNGNLELRRDKAKPMLDWFFGRGAYAKLRPGTILTPEPTATTTVSSEGASKATLATRPRDDRAGPGGNAGPCGVLSRGGDVERAARPLPLSGRRAVRSPYTDFMFY